MAAPALLVIDVQQGLDNPRLGQRNNLEAEANIARLLAHWRMRQLPVIHIRHCSTEANSLLRAELPGNAFKPEAEPLPSEQQFSKSVNSAFIGTGLEDHLHQQKISSLVVVGLTTDHCVSTSVRMAANLGFEVCLVLDATAAFERQGFDDRHYSADDIHRVNLVSLDQEFCVLKSTSELLETI